MKLLIGAWVGLILPLTAQASIDRQQLAVQFDAEFRQEMQKNKIPGGAYAIVSKGRIIKTGSYGVREVGKPDLVNADTAFRLASVSKTFAGAALVLAAQDQQLDLQTPLKTYIPELQLKTTSLEQQLTVEQVLSHSSGFWAHAFEDLIEANQTPAQILPRLAELAQVCGRCYSYQNVLFGLLQPVLERTTGQQYGDYVQRQIFSPLAMQHSSIGMAPFLATTNKAMPHRRAGKGWRVLPIKANFYRLAPAAGVNASVNDLAHYLQAMLGGQPQVFNQRVLQQLQEPLTAIPRKPSWDLWRKFRTTKLWYGRGWRMVEYEQHKLFYHAGVVDGYRPYIAYSPKDDVGLVVLTNAEFDVSREVAEWFWQQVL